MCVAVVTKYSPNDELFGNATFGRGGIHRTFVYVCVCVLIMSPGASEGYGHTPPARTNDGPSIVPSVKRLKIADDTMRALMRDGSAGCQRGAQTNKLELNVQKTIEIQVSHFSSHSPTHPPPRSYRQQGGSVIRETSLKQEQLFCFFLPALRCDLNGVVGQRDRMLINKASHYYKIIGPAVSMGVLLKFPRIIISHTPKILPTIHQQKKAQLRFFFLSFFFFCQS